MSINDIITWVDERITDPAKWINNEEKERAELRSMLIRLQNSSGDGIPIPDSDYDKKIGPMSNWSTKGGWGLENEDPMDDGNMKHFGDY